jgi:hypothetical protein
MANLWNSSVTVGMTKHLTEAEKAQLTEQLNDAVQEICESFEIGA